MKLDTSTIPGFDALPDDVKAALSGYEIAEPDHTGYIDKKIFDKKASEAAELSRQLKAKMSEAEQAEAERAAKEAEREARIAELEKREAVSNYKAQLLAKGFSAEMAADTAAALAEGKSEKLFENIGKFAEELVKAEKARLMQETPKPPAGNGGNAPVTKESFLKMNTADQSAYIKEHPNWMTELK